MSFKLRGSEAVGTSPKRRLLAGSAATVALGVGLSGTALAAPGTNAPAAHSLPHDAQLYTPPPDKGALQQVVDLLRHRDTEDAALVAKMALTPQAVWFTSGTPKQVATDVKQTVVRASALRQVPALVLYNVPGRDCSQYSSGGAGSDSAYQAWIDGVVKGLGHAQAIVIVEPDGLANLPSDCPGAYPGQDVDALRHGGVIHKQIAVMRPDHAAARPRRGDEVVAVLEFGDDLARQGNRIGAIARVVARLPAARLRWRDVDVRAAGFEELDRREPDRGAHQVDEAGDEEADAHGRLPGHAQGKFDCVSAIAHSPISCCGSTPRTSSRSPLAESATVMSPRATIGAVSSGSSKYMSFTTRR